MSRVKREPPRPPRPPRSAIEVGLRRVPELDPDAPLPGSEPRLVGRIADEIRTSGPMTFARFMELALYDPDAGYYTAAGSEWSLGPGRRGDFLTAPESHPIFGWALARHFESVWDALGRPSRFVIREHGAGSGALAEGVLDGLRRSGSPLLEAVRYQAIDVAPARLAAVNERLAGSGLDRHLEPPGDRPAPGAILANELLDALPVHRVEGGADGALLERFVILAGAAKPAATTGPSQGGPSQVGPSQVGPSSPDQSQAGRSDAGLSSAEPSQAGRPQPGPSQASPGFATQLGPPSTLALAARLEAEGVHLQPGQPAEICLEIDGWIARAVAPLERGTLVLIDYAYPAADLYRPDRGSTLRAYHRHRVHADPLVAIGRQDLTAHVDLTAVERAAAAAGLEPIGRPRQAEFLAALEIGELLVALQTDPATTLESYLEARSALVRMLDPRATGAFKVLAFGRGLPPQTSLAGFD